MASSPPVSLPLTSPTLLPFADRAYGALRVAVVARGGLAGEGMAALLREHGLEASLHHVGDGQRWLDEVAPHAVLLLDDLGPLLEPTVDEVRDHLPAVRVLLVASEADAAAVSGAVEMGVHGVVDGHADGRELVQAVRDVIGGRRVFPTMVVLEDAAPAAVHLSRRQRDVLRLLAQGLSNQEIAAELQITVNTVKFHVRAIFRELGIHNRVEAARLWAAGAGPARPFASRASPPIRAWGRRG